MRLHRNALLPFAAAAAMLPATADDADAQKMFGRGGSANIGVMRGGDGGYRAAVTAAAATEMAGCADISATTCRASRPASCRPSRAAISTTTVPRRADAPGAAQ